MHPPRRSLACALPFLLVVVPPVGCRSFEEKPLDPVTVLRDVEDSLRSWPGRDRGDDARGITLREASLWMLEHGPGVREAVAAYETALAVASIDTPIPNPSLEVGPEYGFGSDVTTNRVVPFGALGITIPLGGRLKRNDELNRTRAEVARVDAIARHRELYLELRRAYAALVISRRRLESRRGILAGARTSADSARRLVDAGQATAIDVALFQLERGRAEAEVLDAEDEESDAASRVSSLVGLHASRFRVLPAETLPDPVAGIPALDEAKAALVVHHAELGRQRARYEESEAALRLEIAKQYPDLQIGPSIGGETGDRKTVVGLTLGIELPLFDRNQQAIATAEARREESRVRYEAAAQRALIEVERAHRHLLVATRRYRLLRDTVLAQATSSIGLARSSLEAGSGDALRLLHAERSYRQILVEVVEAELLVHDAWRTLELAVGTPLSLFPSEDRGSAGRVPPSLHEPSEGESSDDIDPAEENES